MTRVEPASTGARRTTTKVRWARASGSEGGAFQSKLSIVGRCSAMKRISSAPFMPGSASGSMWMWKAPPTRASISASGAKKVRMPSRLVHACQTFSIGAATTTCLSIDRSSATAAVAISVVAITATARQSDCRRPTF